MDGGFFRYPDETRSDGHSRRRGALAMSLSVAVHAAIIAILIAIVPAVERHDGSFIVARLIDGAGGSGGSSGARGAAHARAELTPSAHLTRAARQPHQIHHRRESDPPQTESTALKSAEPHREVADSGAGKGSYTNSTAGTGTSESPSSGIGGLGGGDGAGNSVGATGGDGDGSGDARVAYGENPAPAYPQSARRRNEQGTVILRVLVGADGLVRRVEIVETSGFDALDNAAVEAVRRRWHFIAAHRGGAAIESWVRVPIRFSLTEAHAAN